MSLNFLLFLFLTKVIGKINISLVFILFR